MTVSEADTEPIRILICEDDPRTRAYLLKILRGVSWISLVQEAASAEKALELLGRDDKVDLLLLDLELPGMGGLDLLNRLRELARAPEVLILTSFSDEEKVFTAVRRGAAGYLVKGVAASRLVEAIREVVAGGTVIEPRLARRFWNLFQASLGSAEKDPYGLTQGERQVLSLLARGLTNPEMGSVLESSRRGIKLILETLYRKMGVKGRVEAVVEAVKAGLVEI